MKNFIQRYSAVLLAATILTSAALPQSSISAKSLEQIQAQATIDKETSNPSTESLPISVARRVKREIARRFKIPVSQLQIAAAQSRTWNGCFGLPAPNAFCTMIAISGWQVIVTGQQRIWVYHTNQNGSQVRLNQAASLTNQPTQVQLGFIPEEQAVPNPGESVVFQSITQGGISARTTITRLTNDGIITQQIIAPNIRSIPVVIKRLTRDQVNTFLEQVRQQRFDHLNRLRYFSHRGADFEATKLTDGSTVVEYANPLREELPSGLQQVIEIWQKLLRS
ncbi:hypothetical protein [Phormidesmis priestleyi]